MFSNWIFIRPVLQGSFVILRNGNVYSLHFHVCCVNDKGSLLFRNAIIGRFSHCAWNHTPTVSIAVNVNSTVMVAWLNRTLVQYYIYQAILCSACVYLFLRAFYAIAHLPPVPVHECPLFWFCICLFVSSPGAAPCLLGASGRWCCVWARQPFLSLSPMWCHFCS